VVHPADAFAAFRDAGIAFWAGVPDSLLKDFCRYVEDHTPDGSHVIAANEGGAVAIAAGHHLATGGVCGVYLQNSGLGNTVNPLVSLTDPAVYQVPLVLLVGWRGEPGTKDEPQHIRQGETTLQLLDTVGVPALVVPAGTFGAYEVGERDETDAALPVREHALVAIAEALPDHVAIVATTGKTSRELYEHRKRTGSPQRDFLTVGSMGHASQIALGIALATPDRRVCIFDGDGAAVMHLGALAVIGEHAPPNLYHVLYNNHAHESVGGQPTPTHRLDFPRMALAAGYAWAGSAASLEAVPASVGDLCDHDGPALLEILVRQGSRSDLGRPEESPAENRRQFVAWLRR
jgi:phosphonopyruvate decarboxylase